MSDNRSTVCVSARHDTECLLRTGETEGERERGEERRGENDIKRKRQIERGVQRVISEVLKEREKITCVRDSAQERRGRTSSNVIL